MDVEVLVAKIYERKPIWNKWDKQHANRNVVEKLWAEISQEMKCEEAQLNKKWKYLRDQFSVELGKLKPARSGDAANENVNSKWHYFSLLYFLKDVVKPRPSTGNLSSELTNATTKTSSLTSDPEECQTRTEEQGVALPTEECVSLDTSHVDDNTDGDNNIIGEQSSTSKVTQQRRRPNKRSKTDDFNQSILDIEQEKVQYLKEKMKRKEDGNDEDLMFLKSLLPHIKKVPMEQKLMFRCRMQELVQEFAYPSPNTLSSLGNYRYSSSATTSTPQISPASPYFCTTSPTEHQIHQTETTYMQLH